MWWIKWYWDRFLSQYFHFPISVSFLQCPILIIILIQLKTGQMCQASSWQTKQYAFRCFRTLVRKVLSLYFFVLERMKLSCCGQGRMYLASFYILEVTSFIRQHCQSSDLNSDVHNCNTRKKRDIHVLSCKMNVYKKSAINMGTEVYNKLPDHIKGKDIYKTFKKELREFHLHHTFYLVEEFISS